VKGKEMGTLEVTKRKMLVSSLHLRSPVFLKWLMLIVLTISMTISVMVGTITESTTSFYYIVAPQELPIGIITALCGGPFFIWLLRKSSYSFGGGGEK
jgi:ABC-type Fe3+-siderophore transport system permease subunit